MRIAALSALPLMVLCVQPAASQAPTVIGIQLDSFSFTPKDIILNHSQSYVLRLENIADGGHDFTAPEFFAASAIAANDRHLISEGEVEVPPGQVREIRLTAPGAAGKYPLKCSRSFHKMFGMSGSIIVR